MNIFRWTASVVIASCALMTIGCAPGETASLSGPISSTPNPEPTEPTDADLISSASKLLEEYGHLLSDVASDPARDSSKLHTLLTKNAFQVIDSDLQEMWADGRYFSGYPSYTSLQLIQRSLDGDDFQVLVCKDLSAVRAFRAGADITPVSRDNILPMDMGIVREPEGLKIDRTEDWGGQDPC